MTYYSLLGKKEIATAQKQFMRALMKAAEKSTDCTIGFQGENVSADLYWHPDLAFWVTFQELNTRFWNGFGLQRPKKGANLDITCEINFPFQGRNLRIAGILLRDRPESDRIHVAHTGNINVTGGGGGKGKFLPYNRREHNNEGLIDILWPYGTPDQTNALLIGGIHEQDFLQNIARFVQKVDQFKKSVKLARTNQPKKRGL